MRECVPLSARRRLASDKLRRERGSSMELSSPSAHSETEISTTNWQVGRIQPMPSHLPEGWHLVYIREVAILESGHTPSRRKPEYWNGGIPWISLHDSKQLDVKEIFDTTLTVSQLGIDNSSARMLPKGTVVFSRTATVGKVVVMGREMATSQDFANYVCGPKLYNFYLSYLFEFLAPEWERLMAGSTLNTIYMPVFKVLQILLPPFPEQHAIATALSDVDALLAKLDQLLAKKRDLKQAAMQELLTGKRRLPGFVRDWEEKRLKDLVVEIGDGATPSTSNTSNFGGGVPWVVIDDITDNIVSTKTTLSERGLQSCAAKLWQPGTLIVSTGATIGEVGIARVALATKQGICGIVFDARIASTIFLKYWFVKNKNRLLSMAQGSSIKEVRAPTLIQFEIKVPGIEEQEAIASALSTMDAELTALEARREKVRAVKQGMMQELLTGRIRLV